MNTRPVILGFGVAFAAWLLPRMAALQPGKPPRGARAWTQVFAVAFSPGGCAVPPQTRITPA